jgi:hypothetical protein
MADITEREKLKALIITQLVSAAQPAWRNAEWKVIRARLFQAIWKSNDRTNHAARNTAISELSHYSRLAECIIISAMARDNDPQ